MIHCDDGTGTTPTQWPLTKIVKIYPGNDGTICVVTAQASDGNQYTRPAVNIISLLPLKT